MSNALYQSMFGLESAPTMAFTLKEIPTKAQDMVGKMSISGVQPKLSVKLKRAQGLLIPTAEGGDYILKPQIATYAAIPENENCCMDIADALAIAVPPHCLLPLADKSWAYVVKRFDRKGREKIHQENFLQILNKKDKYHGSLEEIGHALRSTSSVPGLDVQLFFERVVLNFILGNGDAHFQNFSMLRFDSGENRLSPAYDIVCTKLVIPKEEDSTLTLNGKSNHLRKKDFDALADYLNIPERVRYDLFIGKQNTILTHIQKSYLPDEEKEQFRSIVLERWTRLGLCP